MGFGAQLGTWLFPWVGKSKEDPSIQHEGKFLQKRNCRPFWLFVSFDPDDGGQQG